MTAAHAEQVLSLQWQVPSVRLRRRRGRLLCDQQSWAGNLAADPVTGVPHLRMDITEAIARRCERFVLRLQAPGLYEKCGFQRIRP